MLTEAKENNTHESMTEHVRSNLSTEFYFLHWTPNSDVMVAFIATYFLLMMYCCCKYEGRASLLWHHRKQSCVIAFT